MSTASHRLIDLGAARVGVTSPLDGFLSDLDFVYQHHGCEDVRSFADVRVSLHPSRGLRFWKNQVSLYSEGKRPFEPYPRNSALPLFEWGSNWLLAQRLNAYLLLHAGVVARDDCAVILPAAPGSGKSTLTCALHLSGWRFLSDEFGVIDTEKAAVLPLMKPAALKNQSIDIIGAIAGATLGPVFPKTRKGNVAHFVPFRHSVAQRHQPARPRLVVFPQYRAGVRLRCTPVTRADTALRLGLNSFNYRSLGPVGFHTVIHLANQVSAFELEFGELGSAIEQIETLFEACA